MPLFTEIENNKQIIVLVHTHEVISAFAEEKSQLIDISKCKFTPAILFCRLDHALYTALGATTAHQWLSWLSIGLSCGRS